MNKSIRITATTLILFFCSQALPWGATGHRVTGEIGSRRLDEKATSQCNQLLNNYVLADVANYLDEMRDNPDFHEMSPLHYVNIDSDSYENSTKNPDGDLILAAETVFKFLESKDPAQLEKLAALKDRTQNEEDAIKFLTHFIGDIHQPLHIGRASDEGGNKTKVTFMGRQTSIHPVWDELMIDGTKLSYTEFATLLNHLTPEQKHQIENPNNLPIHDLLVSWANESWQLTRDIIYKFPDKQPPSQDGSGPAMPILSYKYLSANREILHQQLLKGGVRLAYLLNCIYGDATIPK